MRILYLIPSFGSGGAERQLSLLAPALVKANVEVHIGYCKGGPNLEAVENTGVFLHKFDAFRNHDPRLAISVINLCQAIKPNIVQTWLTQMDILGGFASLLLRIPFIVSERSSGAAYENGWKNHLRKIAGKYAACIVANSSGGLQYWSKYVGSRKLHLIRNCVTPIVQSLKMPYNVLPTDFIGRPLILYAGRFSPVKNLANLVQALIIVVEQEPTAVVMMFGEGPEREAILKWIGDSGFSSRIVVANYSSNLPMWMTYASVCVSVSFYEGHPNVVIEAAAVGCPLVVSEIDAHIELFDNRSVLFVPVNQPSKIAASIIQVINEPASAKVRAIEAKRIVGEFSLDAAVLSYMALYKKYLKVQ